MEKKLYRDEYRKKIAGVCAGLSEYLSIDVAIVRLVFVLMAIFHGSGGLIYIIFWIVLPKKPYIYQDPTVDYTVPPQTPGTDASGNPFGGNPFGGNPYQGNPFPNSSYSNQPFPKQPRSTPIAGIIIGTILIIIGGSILLDDFDIIPDWDFWHLWPLILVAVGGILIFSGEQNKKSCLDTKWKDADNIKADTNNNKQEPTTNAPEATPPADNTPTE